MEGFKKEFFEVDELRQIILKLQDSASCSGTWSSEALAKGLYVERRLGCDLTI